MLCLLLYMVKKNKHETMALFMIIMVALLMLLVQNEHRTKSQTGKLTTYTSTSKSISFRKAEKITRKRSPAITNGALISRLSQINSTLRIYQISLWIVYVKDILYHWHYHELCSACCSGSFSPSSILIIHNLYNLYKCFSYLRV